MACVERALQSPYQACCAATMSRFRDPGSSWLPTRSRRRGEWRGRRSSSSRACWIGACPSPSSRGHASCPPSPACDGSVSRCPAARRASARRCSSCSARWPYCERDAGCASAKGPRSSVGSTRSASISATAAIRTGRPATSAPVTARTTGSTHGLPRCWDGCGSGGASGQPACEGCSRCHRAWRASYRPTFRPRRIASR